MTRGRIGTRGNWVAGASLALAAGGLAWVDGALLALALVGLLLLAVTWVVGRWNVARVEVDFQGPRAVVAGQPARARVEVRDGRRWLDGFGLEVAMEGPGGMSMALAVPWLPTGSVATGELAFSAPGRGAADELRVAVRSDFPWGMFDFERRWEIGREILVLPRSIRPAPLLEGWADAGETRERPRWGDGGEWRGMRDYRPGDRVRTVRWPASVKSLARGGGLLVAEPDPPGGRIDEAWLVFHSAGEGSLIRPDRFERAISLFRGETERLVAAGRTVVWMADFLEWMPFRIDGRRDLAAAGEVLARAKRAMGTQRHEVIGRLAEAGGVVRVFSDEPAERWRGWLAQPERAVDGVRDEKGGRR